MNLHIISSRSRVFKPLYVASKNLTMPYSLLELCLDATCVLPPTLLRDLPPTLKDKLLNKLTKRGYCDDHVLTVLIHSRVARLDLRDCLVTEKGLQALERARCLNVLHLPQPPAVDAELLSENALVRMASNVPVLSILTLTGLLGVTDRVVMALVGGCPNLQEIHLAATPITNHALTALATLTHLTCLNIAKTKVNDLGIQQLMNGGVGESLRELRVDGCASITDDSIETICYNCTHLTILCFHHCPRVSERSRELVGEHMALRMKQVTWTIY
ncbi:unnamed protein product [Meganyctiphanes norvegica]|uniref:Uncharacterized protein n=1 Tax=Meganyctiphanes norvegica TaxID=48144 RepID=A0AAV2QRJ4_MEGNR